MKLALLLPTNKPKVFKEVFMQGVSNILDAKENVVLSINFQPPWQPEEARLVVEQLRETGLDVVYSYNEYDCVDKAHIPFNKIRYDCAAQLFEYSDIICYGLCDDDFLFEEQSGQMLINIMDDFAADMQLGVVQCKRTPNIVPLTTIKVDGKTHTYFTDAGFFFRKLDEYMVFPPTALDNVGAGEELIIGLALASRGYKILLRTKSKINHLINYSNMRNTAWGKDEITCSRRGNRTFIRNNYGAYLNA